VTNNTDASGTNARKKWLLVVVALLLVVAIVLAGHLLPGLTNSEIHRQIRNSFHVIGFAAVAAVIFEILPIRKMMAVAVTLLLVIIIGGLSEVVQSFAGREFDTVDLLRDLSGAVLYLLARLSWRSAEDVAKTGKSRVVQCLISVLLLALVFVPFVYWSGVRVVMVSRYPVILDFGGKWDARLYFPINAYIGAVDDSFTQSGFDGAVLRVQLLRKKWSGLRIETVKSDWSAYEYLSFQVASATDDEIRVNVELSDGEHPGVRAQHLLGGGEVGSVPTRIRVPLHDGVAVPGRPDLDITSIKQIYVIARNSGTGSGLLLADLRLE